MQYGLPTFSCGGSLAVRMDITVHVEQTKAGSGGQLGAEAMKSEQGEHVMLLLQIHANPQEARTLEKECIQIVTHALLETEGGASGRLDGTLKELNGLFKGLLI